MEEKETTSNELQSEGIETSSESSRIGIVGIIIFSIITLFLDLMDILSETSLATGVLAPLFFILKFLSWFFSLTFQFYLFLKRVKGFFRQFTFLLGSLADTIPFLGILPIKTIAFFITVYLVNKNK